MAIYISKELVNKIGKKSVIKAVENFKKTGHISDQIAVNTFPDRDDLVFELTDSSFINILGVMDNRYLILSDDGTLEESLN